MKICKDLNAKDLIATIDEWEEKCPPTQKNHWKDNRSAKELAREWMDKEGQNLRKLLASHADFQEIELLKASPEYNTDFDAYSSGRKHDLLIIGQQANNKVVISIEGKVDEPFGNDTVESYYMKSLLKRFANVNTKVPERIEGLIKALFDQPYSSKILTLQYQLLHAVAGTLVEAKKQAASKALFVVHTFITDEINKEKHRGNNKSLDDFLGLISSNAHKNIQPEEIHGPFYRIGNEWIPSDIPLYIGKITQRIANN